MQYQRVSIYRGFTQAQKGHTARFGILRMRNILASTTKYPEVQLLIIMRTSGLASALKRGLHPPDINSHIWLVLPYKESISACGKLKMAEF